MPVIRRGEAADLPAVAAIQSACPETAQWPVADYLRYEFAVADLAGTVAGFLVWRHLAEDECEVLNLAVGPEFRRQGIARELLTRLLRLPGLEVYLEVRESNLVARTLYKSMGFQEVSRRERYYENPSESAIVMKFHSC
jgi:ribosomal-protein-alanine N-acetyltransferase